MATFAYNGEILQTFTVDDTGTYQITAYGAQGGLELGSTGIGGEGAEVSADVHLTAGTTLDILVGAQGDNAFGFPGDGGGGGGGAFVAEEEANGDDLALVIAAGGGGSGNNGADGSAGLGLGASNPSSSGGSDTGGGGGGGLASDGANGGEGGGFGGSSFDEDGAGGEGAGGQGGGGYGGGGGAGFGGGGGGGYFGGDGGGGDTDQDSGAGGGGGISYIAPSATEVSSASGVNAGNGYVTIDIVCFASGTRIVTARGDVAVEDLRVGELVVTAAGLRRPIKWIGHRTVDCQKHVDPWAARPVRIAAHAFGQDKPVRDLFVSPGHAICVDILGETLIPARALVNGSTIAQVEADTITYWHVELDAHDILIAEGLPTESYANCNNRDFFVENPTAATEGIIDEPALTLEDYCRPFHDQGPLVAVVRERLLERAAKIGWTLAPSVGFGDLHLLVDGRRIDPVTRGSHARFSVPAGARDVWLISSAARPRALGQNEDGRLLGVRVAALTIDDGFERRAIALDDVRLSKGFHEAEAEWRWTNGRASLPAALWDGDDGFFLTVELAGEALPQWRASSKEESTLRGGLRLVGAA